MPATIAIAILVPEGRRTDHLKILSSLSAKLANSDFAKKIKTSTLPQIVKLINETQLETEEKMKKTSPKSTSKVTYDVVGVTSCPTGIAHTYMAAEKITEAVEAHGFKAKIETQGQTTENTLSQEEIDNAKLIILAVDRQIDMSRFAGKTVIETNTREAIHKPSELIEKGIEGTHKKQTVVQATSGPIKHSEYDAEMNFSHFGRRAYGALMNGVSHMLPFVVFGGIMIALSFLIDIANAGESGYGSVNPVAA